jgi:predicted PurR-regulated permease PerM
MKCYNFKNIYTIILTIISLISIFLLANTYIIYKTEPFIGNIPFVGKNIERKIKNKKQVIRRTIDKKRQQFKNRLISNIKEYL